MNESLFALERRCRKLARFLAKYRDADIPPVILRNELEITQKMLDAAKADCFLDGDNPYDQRRGE